MQIASASKFLLPFPSKTGREWLRWAYTLWVVLAVAASVKAIVQPDSHSVYMIFAAASRHWWADLPLYTFYEGLDTYRYTPTFAVAMTPLAVLPDWAGAILWNLMSIALLLWALRRFVREILPGEWPPAREALLVALVLVGSLRGIWSAQSNALVIALAMLAAVAIQRKRWWTASLLLAVPVFVKLWPVALVLLLVVLWPRQLLARFSAVMAVGLTVPFLTRPAAVVCQQYYEYYYWLTGCLSLGRWSGYRDAVTIFEQLGIELHRYVYPVIQLEAALLLLGWCLWQRQQLGSTRRLLLSILAIWPAWQLLLGPGSERLTYGIIAIAASWALLESFAQKRCRVLAATAWGMISVFSMGTFERLAQPAVPFAPALLPSGVVVFILWLMVHETAPRTVTADLPPSRDLVPTALVRRAMEVDCPDSRRIAQSNQSVLGARGLVGSRDDLGQPISFAGDAKWVGR